MSSLPVLPGTPEDEGGIGARGFCNSPQKDGTRCRRLAGQGTDHMGYGPCRIHPNAFDSDYRAVRLEAHQVATRIDTTPEEALLDCIQSTAGVVEWIRDRLDHQSTDANALVWMAVYAMERDRLAKYSADALRVGLAEREVRLKETTAALVSTIIAGVLDDVGLTADQRVRVPGALRRHLYAVREQSRAG